MKKLILSAAMLAFGSFSAFSANLGACVSGTLLSALVGNNCQVSNGGFTWDLAAWGLNPGTSQNYVPNVPVADMDIQVSFAAVSNGGALGFAVSFMDAPNGSNYFNAVTGQSANWESYFTVNHTVGGAAAAIQDVYHSVEGANATGNGNVSVSKNINFVSGLPVNPNIVANIITTSFGQSPNPQQMSVAGNTGLLGVVDIFQIQAATSGGGGTASITSYTNTFYTADQGIPEPMSFVLMGAGLVGIAVLRRRNG